MNNYHKNYFIAVRPEVVLQICQFLDITSYLQLRLLNSDMNFIVKLISTKKKNEIKCWLTNLKDNNQKIIEWMNLIEQDKQKLKEQWASVFNKLYFIEIKALSSPPQILLEIIKYFIFLMNPTEKISKDNYTTWLQFKQLVANINMLIKRIFELEPERISETKLRILQSIYELNDQSIFTRLDGAKFMHLYIESIIEVRKRDYYNIIYVYQHKLEVYDKMIRQLEILEQKIMM